MISQDAKDYLTNAVPMFDTLNEAIDYDNFCKAGDPDEAYERHLEQAGYEDAREQELVEAQRGIVDPQARLW